MLCKEYVKVIPTVVVWDDVVDSEETPVERDGEEPEDEVWNAMQTAESESEDEGKRARRMEKKTRTA